MSDEARPADDDTAPSERTLAGLLARIGKISTWTTALLLLAVIVVHLPSPTPTNSLPTAAPSPTSITPPTPTPTTAPIRHLIVHDTALTQTCPSFYSALPSISIVLDNTASTVPQPWHVAAPPSIPGLTQPWASARPTSGAVPAHGTQMLTLTPYARSATSVRCHATPTLLPCGSRSGHRSRSPIRSSRPRPGRPPPRPPRSPLPHPRPRRYPARRRALHLRPLRR